MAHTKEDITRVIEFSRPPNTTAYAVNDAIRDTLNDTGTTPLTGMDFGIGFSDLWVAYAKLETDLNTFICTPTIHFYNTAAPPTALPADNSAFARVWANRKARIGKILMPGFNLDRAGDGVLSTDRDDLRYKLRFLGDDAAKISRRVLYPLIEIASGTPTPSSGQNFRLTLQLVSGDA